MRMRQIIAKDMKEAMILAREELGEDAVLLSTEKRSNKNVVVTFAIEEEDFEQEFLDPLSEGISNDNEEQAPPSHTLFQSTFATNDGLDDDIRIHPLLFQKPAPPSLTKTQAQHPMRAANNHRLQSAALKTPRSSYPAYELLLSILNYHRVPEDLYIHITALLDKIDMPEQLSYDGCEQILTKALTPNVQVKPLAAALPASAPKAFMAVGPHGAGKTTLISKLATRAHMTGTNVTLISTDIEKMGGTAALDALKDALGCQFFIAESRAELKKIIQTQLGKTLILIDSPGVNIYNFQEMKALGEMANLVDIEPILTCPAGLDADEAIELASVFSFLNIERFALTRVDSTRHFSTAYALMQHEYALACTTDSAKPSDSITPASHHLLAQLSCAYIRERMAA